VLSLRAEGQGLRLWLRCRKILKKHDKMTNTELSGRLMPTVSDMLAKEQRKGALEGLKNSVVHEYALIAHSGGEPEAEQELGRHRRDQLTFERNTGIDKILLFTPSSLAQALHVDPQEGKREQLYLHWE